MTTYRPICQPPAAPVNTVLPSISGTTVEGQTLTGTDGTWTGTPTPTLAAQWRRNGVNISGATGPTYLQTAGDVGATITRHVVATNAVGSASATSAGVGPVTAAPSGDDGYTAGALTITMASVEQPGINVAPAAVWFEVSEVTGCDAVGPSTGVIRDGKFHDLKYDWDFDDPANATPSNAAALNLPTVWKNINRAEGRRVGHVFSDPGTYTVRVTVYEPSTRRKGTATVEVTIGDPKVLFAGNRTIIFDPTGSVPDPAAYGYAGATMRSTWSAVQTARNTLGLTTGQILLAPGAELVATQLCSDVGWGNIRIGSLSYAAKPIIRDWTATNNQWLIRDYGTTKPECVLFGLDLRGDWDSTKQQGVNIAPYAIFGISGVTTHLLMMHRCNFSGFTVVGLANPNNVAVTPYTMFSELTVTNWQDYGIHGNEEGHSAIIACSSHQSTDALSGGQKDLGFYNQHGPLRVFEGLSTHIDCCSLFSRNGWSPAGGGLGELAPYTHNFVQPALRLNTTGADNFECIVTRVVMHGGLSLEEQGQAIPDKPGNYLFDKFIQINTGSTQETIELRHSGITMRNGIGYFANVPKAQANNMGRWIYVSNEDGDAANDEGLQVYNCTVIDARSNANADNVSMSFILNDTVENGVGISDLYLNVLEENNIFNQINRSPASNPYPVDTATSIGVVLLDKGPRKDFLYESGTLASDVAHNAHFALSYADVKTSLYNVGLVDYGSATSQAYWQANGGTRHKLNMGSARIMNSVSTFEVTYEATEIRIYNRTGAPWPAGTAWTLKLDRAAAVPAFDPQFDTTPMTVPTCRPPSVYAIGGTKRAHDDLLGTQRPATGDTRGALLPA